MGKGLDGDAIRRAVRMGSSLAGESAMSLMGHVLGRGAGGFGHHSTAEEVTEGLDLSGRTYLVTGCTSGLGSETMRVLAARGATVLGAARTIDKARAACGACGDTALPLACELSEPSSVRACVAAVRDLRTTLDGIVCNAGIMALPRLQQQHGYEAQFFTNHVGHFILVTGLLDALAEDGRVVMVSSAAHRGAPRAGIELDNLTGQRGYSSWRAYGQSKLANVLFAKELAKRFAGSARTANAIHPGVIRTQLGRHMPALFRATLAVVQPVFLKTVAQGAATQCYVAAHPAAAAHSGEYFADCKVARASRLANDPVLAERLWEATERIVAELV